MKRIGILGLHHKAGSMIKFIKKSGEFEIVGLYDQSLDKARQSAGLYGLQLVENPFSLISKSDLLIVAQTDEASFNLITECIQANKQVVIETPYNLTVKETDYIEKLANEADLSVVPSLIYSFSPTLLNVKSYLLNARFLELRYSTSPVSKGGSFSLTENMLNLIDIVLTLVKGNVRRASISGVNIVGNIPQIVSMRFDFDNGSAATVKADYMSSTEETIITAYQPGQIIQTDLIKNVSSIKSYNSSNPMSFEVSKLPKTKDENPYKELFEYMKAFNDMKTAVSMLGHFKNTLSILKVAEAKLLWEQ